MESIIIYIVLCLILPIGLLCFFLENRAKKIMLSVGSGVIACCLAFFLNNFFLDVLNVDTKYFATTFAPMIEELLKFIPVAIIIFVLKKGRRPSIANCFAVGVGFCIVENFFYLFNNLETANIFWVIARCISAGLMHSMSAVIIGIGSYYANKDKGLRILGTITSLFAAFIYHGTYNLLVSSSSFQVLGAIIPALTFLTVLLFVKTGKTPIMFSFDENNE